MPISSETLKQFGNVFNFIETGCGSGHGIDAALEAGYHQVFSIELYYEKYAPVRDRFLNDRRVNMILGDSAIMLKGLLLALPEGRITFWLDAHYDFAVRGEGNNLGEVQPIMQELDAIEKHAQLFKDGSYRNHVILIDDWQDFVQPKPWFHSLTEKDIKNKILSINSNYKFKTLDGAGKDTILSASVGEVKT